MGHSDTDPEVFKLIEMMRPGPEKESQPIPIYDIAQMLIKLGPERKGWEKSLRSLIHTDGYYFENQGPFHGITAKFWACHCLARFGLSADLVVPELLNQAAWTVKLLVRNRGTLFGGYFIGVAVARLLCTYLERIHEIPLPVEAWFLKAIENSNYCHSVEPYLALVLAKTGVRSFNVPGSLLLYKTRRTEWETEQLERVNNDIFVGFDEAEIFYGQCRPVLEKLYPEYDSYETLLTVLFINAEDDYKSAILKEMATCKVSRQALNFIIGTTQDPDPKIRVASCVALRRFASVEQGGPFGWVPADNIHPKVKEALEMLRRDHEKDVRLFSHYCLYRLGIIEREILMNVISDETEDEGIELFPTTTMMLKTLSGTERDMTFNESLLMLY